MATYTGKYSRLYALGKEKMLKINNELAKQNTSCVAVARMIQQDWKDFQDVGEKTLIQQINRYRLDLLQGKLKKKVDLTLPASEDISVQFLREKPLNVFQEMCYLVNVQVARVEMAFTREQKMNIPVSGTDAMVKTLKELLMDTQKMRFEMGKDDYLMPVSNGGRSVSASVTLPNGIVVKTQVDEAIAVAEKVLAKHRIPHIVDVETVEVEPKQ